MYFPIAEGLNTHQVPKEDDLTVLIDYVKYQELTKLQRTPRQYHLFARQFDPSKIFRLPSIFPTPAPLSQRDHPNRDHPQRDRHGDCDEKGKLLISKFQWRKIHLFSILKWFLGIRLWPSNL